MIAVAVLGLYVVRYGIGRHQYYLLLTPGVLPEIAKLSYVAQVLIICSVMFVRSSVAMFLFRIFGHRKGWKLMLYSVMFWILLSWVTALVFVLAACKPITKVWEPLSPGVCWDAKTTLITGAYIGGKLLSQKRWIIIIVTAIKPPTHLVIFYWLFCQLCSCGTSR